MLPPPCPLQNSSFVSWARRGEPASACLFGGRAGGGLWPRRRFTSQRGRPKEVERRWPGLTLLSAVGLPTLKLTPLAFQVASCPLLGRRQAGSSLSSFEGTSLSRLFLTSAPGVPLPPSVVPAPRVLQSLPLQELLGGLTRCTLSLEEPVTSVCCREVAAGPGVLIHTATAWTTSAYFGQEVWRFPPTPFQHTPVP